MPVASLHQRKNLDHRTPLRIHLYKSIEVDRLASLTSPRRMYCYVHRDVDRRIVTTQLLDDLDTLVIADGGCLLPQRQESKKQVEEEGPVRLKIHFKLKMLFESDSSSPATTTTFQTLLDLLSSVPVQSRRAPRGLRDIAFALQAFHLTCYPAILDHFLDTVRAFAKRNAKH